MQELAKVGAGKLDEVVANVVADKSDGTARKYTERLQHFAAWLRAYGQPLDKRAVGAYRRELAGEGKSSLHHQRSSGGGAGAPARGRCNEPDPVRAGRAHGLAIKSVRQKGARLGNWLAREEAQRLLDAPDTETLKGKRDRAILALMLFCGLRRSEVTGMRLAHLQEREGHTVIADLLGKGMAMPVCEPERLKVPAAGYAIYKAIEIWLEASGRELAGELSPYLRGRSEKAISWPSEHPQRSGDLQKVGGQAWSTPNRRSNQQPELSRPMGHDLKPSPK